MNPIIIMLVALFGSVLLVILFRPVIAWLHEYVAVQFLYNAVKHAGLAYSKKDILSMHSHTDVLQEIGLRSMDLSQEVFVLITIIRIKLQKYNQDDVEEVYDLIDDVEEQLLAIIKQAKLEGHNVYLTEYDDSVFPDMIAYEEDGEQIITTYLVNLRQLLRSMGGITHSLSSYRLVHPLHTKPLI